MCPIYIYTCAHIYDLMSGHWQIGDDQEDCTFSFIISGNTVVSNSTFKM